MNFSGQNHDDPTTQAIEIAIRLSLIFALAAWCFQILTPFLSLIIWGAIIAIAIYPLFTKLLDKLGGKRKLAVTLITLVGIALILVPVILLSDSLIEGASGIGDKVTSGTAHISPPAESVREWPLVGEKEYAFWLQASQDLTGLLGKYPEQVAAVGKKLLGMATGAGLGILQFIISLIIAAAFLASADSVSAAMKRLAWRLSGEHGEDLLLMSTNTVRSVAVGVSALKGVRPVSISYKTTPAEYRSVR